MAQGFKFDGESLIAPGQIFRPTKPDDLPSSDQMVIAKAELALTLDLSLQQFRSEVDPHAIVSRLSQALHQIRRRFHASIWSEIVFLAQNHPVAQFLLQDPFTKWSFDKPRGYSGDAHLLDFIYGHAIVEAEIAASTALGRAIYEYTKNASSSVAVRERRDILAQRVDEHAKDRPGSAEVLAMASGHLREATLSTALREGKIRRWIALDQDPLSVGTVARDFAGTCVEAVDGTVKSLLSNKHAFGHFDYIYAAGLYDYLTLPVAAKLTRKCVEMLKPGGSFLFANFSQEIEVDGYMEAFMSWPLLLRSENDMQMIADASASKAETDVSIWFGKNRNIIYCEITRVK
ncbi:class I SAM-dependent methyltransferase [Rhizobium sp. LEGMi198b]|uniref:class I SAM-dependent methyltransferase n=1 Tax=unclassified Rhizobium TaxID=2613769 RepID=UPI000CDF3D7E|nr:MULTISPECIES: class I SAM-dependent methyltransferase [Rhizobium]AVA24623.1 SAM-dependent methyltransferase protein [Rhizobium sp. NXC24]UWU24535.1 class I SAM-dependent methyltransferase [Rhizobium tropici]WFU05510.1 class I SAM-dependent methyltransferase [Rhizobium sp. CB3171]